MTIRTRKSAPDSVRTAPRQSPVQAAEAARARMLDPAYRVEEERRRGRGAVSNPGGRYEPVQSEAFDDGWEIEDERPAAATEVIVETARKIITKNDSPD